jgi:hypothetical protein
VVYERPLLKLRCVVVGKHCSQRRLKLTLPVQSTAYLVELVTRAMSGGASAPGPARSTSVHLHKGYGYQLRLYMLPAASLSCAARASTSSRASALTRAAGAQNLNRGRRSGVVRSQVD